MQSRRHVPSCHCSISALVLNKMQWLNPIYTVSRYTNINYIIYSFMCLGRLGGAAPDKTKKTLRRQLDSRAMYVCLLVNVEVIQIMAVVQSTGHSVAGEKIVGIVSPSGSWMCSIRQQHARSRHLEPAGRLGMQGRARNATYSYHQSRFWTPFSPSLLVHACPSCRPLKIPRTYMYAQPSAPAALTCISHQVCMREPHAP